MSSMAETRRGDSSLPPRKRGRALPACVARAALGEAAPDDEQLKALVRGVSEALPVELIARIFDHLPLRHAARLATLSRPLRDAFAIHGRFSGPDLRLDEFPWARPAGLVGAEAALARCVAARRVWLGDVRFDDVIPGADALRERGVEVVARTVEVEGADADERLAALPVTRVEEGLRVTFDAIGGAADRLCRLIERAAKLGPGAITLEVGTGDEAADDSLVDACMIVQAMVQRLTEEGGAPPPVAARLIVVVGTWAVQFRG